ncbi:MAG TPA: DsbA family protein [Enterovirga sp.]|jgi:protein-disulfide isomerase
MITRRQGLQLIGSAAVTAALFGPFAAAAQDASVAELMKPGPLGDAWLGPESAKVTIIEYASLTCSHCAHFHETTFPELKKRYIEPGQVRFTLREFPLDPLATAGFMIARADGGARYYPITDLLFDTQKSWAFVQKPLDALTQILKQAGITQERIEAILKDQKLYEAINTVKNRGMEVFKIDSTPTFFVNGKRVPGAVSMDELEKIIKPMLGA